MEDESFVRKLDTFQRLEAELRARLEREFEQKEQQVIEAQRRQADEQRRQADEQRRHAASLVKKVVLKTWPSASARFPRTSPKPWPRSKARSAWTCSPTHRTPAPTSTPSAPGSPGGTPNAH